MTNFVKFVEENDWEGETWTFWLQLDGNEDELEKLDGILNEFESDESSAYRLELEIALEEDAVDVLVEHGGSGYMDSHNKVTGHLAIPNELAEATVEGLYKGGVRALFEE